MSLQSCGGEAVAIAFVADKTGFPLFLVSPHVQRQLAGRGKRGVADITGGDIYTGSVQLDVFVIQRVTIVASGYGGNGNCNSAWTQQHLCLLRYLVCISGAR